MEAKDLLAIFFLPLEGEGFCVTVLRKISEFLVEFPLALGGSQVG